MVISDNHVPVAVDWRQLPVHNVSYYADTGQVCLKSAVQLNWSLSRVVTAVYRLYDNKNKVQCTTIITQAVFSKFLELEAP